MVRNLDTFLNQKCHHFAPQNDYLFVSRGSQNQVKWVSEPRLGHVGPILAILSRFLDDVDRSGIHFGRCVINFALNLGVLLEILKVKSANLDVTLGGSNTIRKSFSWGFQNRAKWVSEQRLGQFGPILAIF